MTPVQQVLLDAADLVERGWTQGGSAQTADGNFCQPLDPAATCWCAAGALNAAAGSAWDIYYAARRHLEAALGPTRPIIAWNDAPERTQAEVVQALRNAAVDGAA